MTKGLLEARTADVQAIESTTRTLADTGGDPSMFVNTPGRSLGQNDLIIVSESELRRRIRRSVASWSFVATLFATGISVLVSVAVRDRVRGPERLSDFSFAALGELDKGNSVALSPGDINHLDEGAWRVLEPQLWTRIACQNSAIQGRGAGHDLTFTVLRGTDPHALAPTMLSCRIAGSDDEYATCDAMGSLLLAEGEWVTILAVAGPNIENGARVRCDVHRYSTRAAA